MVFSQKDQEKINDFKSITRVFLNSENNPEKEKVIDAIFLNIEKYYEEFKDEVPYIPAELESYQYHLLQPVNGSYSLLDFLINRALTNIEGIYINDSTNCFDHAKIVEINIERYEGYNNLSKEFLDMQKLKSRLHETSHAIHAQDIQNDNMYHPGRKCIDNKYNLEQKVNYLQKYKDRYPNLLDLSNKNIPASYNTDYFSQPFYSQSASEGITEMYATLFSGLYNQELYGIVKIGNDICIPAPNYLNGYASFTRFYYHLRNLVSKKSLFSSIFFSTDEAIKEFSENNSTEITESWEQSKFLEREIQQINITRSKFQIEKISTQSPEDKLNVLLMEASYEYMEDSPNEVSEEAQLILDKIFLEAYKKKIAQGYNPENLKNKLEISALLSPMIYDEKTGEWEPTEIAGEYFDLYQKVMEEKNPHEIYHITRDEIIRDNLSPKKEGSHK